MKFCKKNVFSDKLKIIVLKCDECKLNTYAQYYLLIDENLRICNISYSNNSNIKNVNVQRSGGICICKKAVDKYENNSDENNRLF